MSAIVQYYIVIILYFIGMLLVGFWFNKKVESEEDYFIARDKLGPATIGFSFSATQMSGSTFMGAIGQCKMLGYNFIPAAISSAAAPWFSYVLLGDRIRKISSRLKSVTLADIFESRYYSKYASFSATIIMLVAFIPMIAAQLKAAANSFEVLLGIPYLVGVFIFGGIVIIYTILGGMYAVAVTDLIQGIIMIAGFAILAPVVVTAVGGFSEMHIRFAQLNPKGITMTGIMPPLWVVSAFIVWGFFQIGGSPASITRFLISTDDKKLRKAMIYSVLFQSFIYLAFTLISIASGVLLPDLKNADLTVPTLIQQFFPPILGGVVLAAALGAMMSTIDSIILMAGSLVSVNIFDKFMEKKLDTTKSLKVSRYVTLTIGVLSTIIAINPPAAIMWIVTMSFSFMAAAFTFPLLLGIWWPRATKEGGLAGIVGGAISCIIWYILGYMKYHNFNNWIGGIWPAIFGGLVSLALIIVVSYMTPPAPQEVLDIFYDDIVIDGSSNLTASKPDEAV